MESGFNVHIICVAFYKEMLNSTSSFNMDNIMKNCILSRPNYAKWKYRVDLYMRFYDYSSSFKPNDESVESDKISYSLWIEADNKMKI